MAGSGTAPRSTHFTAFKMVEETSWARFQNAVVRGEVSLSLCPRLPASDELNCRPYREGEVAVHHKQFNAGVRHPLTSLSVEMLRYYKMCPAQITPNAWGTWNCFVMLSRLRGGAVFDDIV